MKKGFTLIELLAVIVILGIIALIATPIVKKSIDDARKKTFKDSVHGIMRTGEMLYTQDLINEEVTFTYTDGIMSSSVAGISLDYKGEKPKTGQVRINDKGQIAVAIHNGNYCAEIGYYDSEVTINKKSEEECKLFECGMQFIDARDGNTYDTVQIGEQCWMANNLKYTGNGCLENSLSQSEPFNGCATHQAGEGSYLGTYNSWTETQVMYQWDAAMNGSKNEGAQGICPSGWYIPTEADWNTLKESVNDTTGAKLKSETYWNGTNILGFNALPAGGYGGGSIELASVGDFAAWLSSTSKEVEDWQGNIELYNSYYALYSNSSNLSGSPAKYPSSVRCIMEQ